MFGVGMLAGLTASRWSPAAAPEVWNQDLSRVLGGVKVPQPLALNGRPQLYPLPQTFNDVWECQVVVVGGSLGGVAAARHAMAAGAQTCLIEVSPWLGGQISSQGVSALDESLQMRRRGNFSRSWENLRQTIAQQVVELPDWSPHGPVSFGAVD
jgi:alpha-beta hydrolase superfamily lysophospholipase